MKLFTLLALSALLSSPAEAARNHCAAAAKIFRADPAFLGSLYEINDAGKPRFFLFGLALGARGVDIRRDGHSTVITRVKRAGEIEHRETAILDTDSEGRITRLWSEDIFIRGVGVGVMEKRKVVELRFSHGLGHCVFEKGEARKEASGLYGVFHAKTLARHDRARCVTSETDCYEPIMDELALDPAEEALQWEVGSDGEGSPQATDAR